MLNKKLNELKNSIEQIKKEFDIKEDIKIIAVTKTLTVNRVQEALELGIKDIGENKVQEIMDKYDKVKGEIRWHMIGHLQKNKVKYIIDKVYMIHSIESLSLIEELQKRASLCNRIIKILVQVNISKEESKYGISENEALDFINKTFIFPNIKIEGLMTMAPYTDDEELIRKTFRGLKDLSNKIKNENIRNVDMNILSMGMSGDYEIAIQEGSNMIRIGSSLFGSRH